MFAAINPKIKTRKYMKLKTKLFLQYLVYN